MKRIIVASLVLLALLTACIVPIAGYAQEEWGQVQTFTGKGDKTTAPFHISGSKWRINWTVKAEEPKYAAFYLRVYREGETVGSVENISHDGVGSDTTYIYEGNGSFYIRVGAANLKSWTIEIEDCISAAPPPPPPPSAPLPQPKPTSPSPPKPPPAKGDGACGCFIATAAYGTDTAQEIDILREFRDEILLPNNLCSQFVSFYYRNSPPIADYISKREMLRTIVREGFVDPIVGILNLSHTLWSEKE